MIPRADITHVYLSGMDRDSSREADTCEGLIDEANADGVRLKLIAKDETGEVKLTGTATIAPEFISAG